MSESFVAKGIQRVESALRSHENFFFEHGNRLMGAVVPWTGGGIEQLRRPLTRGRHPGTVQMMPGLYEIRADYDSSTLVVYQAYPAAIAEPALERQRFVAPFSFERMTWIKPSFLWLMHRSNWGKKRGQERTLAVRIDRAGWEHALALGVLTSPLIRGRPRRLLDSCRAKRCTSRSLTPHARC